MFRFRFFRRAQFRIALSIALLLVLASLTPSAFSQANTMPPAIALSQTQTLSVESFLNPDGTLNTKTGANGSVDLRGWNVTLDSKRGPVLSPAHPARSGEQSKDAAPTTGNTWSALPHNGLNNTVFALAVSGSNLYVGGTFTQTADGSVTNLNNIAKFDGTNWSALPHNGLNDWVFDLAVLGSNLYVGGTFTQTADGSVTNLNRIAKFDGTNWSALPHNGLNDWVYTFAVSGSNLYVGGDFTKTADSSVTNLNRITKFDGTNWSALPNNGLNDRVLALAVSGSNLYVGGNFTVSADGGVTNLNSIAKFDGTNWSALPHNGLNNGVDALAVSGSNLYVGGYFTQTADSSVTNLNKIAKFDGTNWSALPNNGLNNGVDALAVSGTNLYVGGNFTKTADGTVTNLNRIAKFTLAPTQTGPTFVVNTNADSDDGLCDNAGQGHGNQDCTLREAINAANANSGFDVIHFAGDYFITLSASLPTITDNLTIDGETHDTVISGASQYRLLTINADSNVYLDHLSLAGGKAEPSLSFGNSGGAIYSEGGALDIRNSTITNQFAADYGGAIFSTGTVLISNSTLAGNTAELGGAVSAHDLTVRNSTFSENNAPSGAALYAGGALTLKNSILANSTGPDCSLGGTLSSANNNLIESTGSDACGLTNGVDGNKIGIDPQLGAFGYYGSVLATYSLFAVSPAIDAGDNVTCAADPINNLDQRGSARPFGARCDMGSFEKKTTDCTPTEKPAKPTLLKPTQNQSMNKTKVNFDWGDTMCATSYKITVKNTTTGAKVTQTVTPSKAKLTLTHGNQKWSVQACNANGCTKSVKWKFTN